MPNHSLPVPPNAFRPAVHVQKETFTRTEDVGHAEKTLGAVVLTLPEEREGSDSDVDIEKGRSISGWE